VSETTGALEHSKNGRIAALDAAFVPSGATL